MASVVKSTPAISLKLTINKNRSSQEKSVDSEMIFKTTDQNQSNYREYLGKILLK